MKANPKQERLEREAKQREKHLGEYLAAEKGRARAMLRGLPEEHWKILEPLVEALFRMGRRLGVWIDSLPPLPEPMKYRPKLWVIDPRPHKRPDTGRLFPSAATAYPARDRFFPHQAVALHQENGHLIACDKDNPSCIGGVMPEEDQELLTRNARPKRQRRRRK